MLIARHGAVILDKGYGFADAARRVRNTPQTRFRIGSITKQFTALAILQLQERRELSVRAAICTYLSDCPTTWKPITIQELLSHTSGIPDYTDPHRFPTWNSRLPATPSQLVARFRVKPLLFHPGTRFSYSNSDYVLLGLIIERASGEPYATYLKRHIFTPLRLANTGYEASRSQIPHEALGYVGIERTRYEDPSEFFAAADLYSTVRDLYTWDRSLSGSGAQLLTRASLRAMFTPWWRFRGAGDATHGLLGYGDGWVIGGTLEGHRVIWHAGDLLGFHSINMMLPNDHGAVIVLSNQDQVGGIMHLIVRQLIKRTFQT